MRRELLASKKKETGLSLDPRTKLALLITIALFVLSGGGGAASKQFAPILAAVPLLLLLTEKSWKGSVIYVVLYGGSYILQLWALPHLSGLPNFLVVAICGFFMRFVPGIMMGYITVRTTTVSEFVAAMKKLHLPEQIIIPMSVIFRFFPTVVEEYNAIGDAMKMRGIRFGGGKASAMLEYRLVPVIMCSVKIGEELNAAALTRGLGGPVKRTNICEIGFHVQDVFFLLLCVVAFAIPIVTMITGGRPMIECKKVSFSYPPNETDIGDRKGHGTLRNIDLSINDGDFVLLCGTSGCGKTTLTRLFNGLIPHYYDGKLEGTVMLDGEDMSGLSLFDISKKVGSVFQNPRSQFFNVDTTSEIAFGCENHGLEEAEIRKRVKLVSEQLNLTNLLDRSVFSLSGGEKQKIACGSAAAVEPDVFVLDEPSSNLDAYSIADFRKLLKILKSQGKTIIIAEHRLYYLYDLADRIIYLSDGEIQGDYTLPEFQLIPAAEKAKMGLRPLGLGEFADIEPASLHSGQGIWKLNHFHFAYKKQPETLSLENIELPAGNVTAVIGHNGAGKTTLSRCLCGLEKRCKGILEKDGTSYSSKQRLKLCYMVMQDVNHQLFTESVLEEVLLSMPGKDSDESPENVAKAEAILTEMDLLPYKACHPMGLSGGQKQRVAIASAIASERPVILFDEPTSGLDLFHMRQVADSVKGLADSGKTIVIVTHDPEFILRCCNYVIHLENGRLEESYFLQDTEGRERLFNFFMMEGGGGNQTV